jgi:hypothetical protein
MRTSLLVPAVALVVFASCGRGFEPPPGTRPDPLEPCEELGRAACGARSDCAVEALFCATVCVDDGQGGCRPCDAFQCVPVAPRACEQLDAAACGARSDCVLETPECATPNSAGSAAGCLACDPAPRCVTRPTPPNPCEGLDGPTCSATPGCEVIANGACPPCAPGATCSPCASISCVPVQPPSRCEGLDATTCEATPGCLLAGTRCPYCGPNMLCEPCEDSLTCIEAPVPPPPSPCDGLDATACEATPGCGLLLTGCPPCEAGAACPACSAAVTCVPVDPPSPCLGYDVATCSTHPECEVVAYACTAECRDDGNGGCLPCDAPPPSCQPRAEEPVAGCGSGGSQPPMP